MFEKVKVGRASDEVVQQVKKVIISGELATGDRLPSERDLAERFGLSRMTIRDALRVLESQGLIEIKVGASGGAFVREPNLDLFRESLSTVIQTNKKTSLLELAEARKIVETAIVELAAQRATPDDLKVLRRAVQSAKKALAEGKPITQSSVDFHTGLARASKNYVLNLIVNSFRSLFSNALEQLLPAVDMAPRGVHEHEVILKAVEAGDSEKARQAMIEHLEYFEEMVRQFRHRSSPKRKKGRAPGRRKGR